MQAMTHGSPSLWRLARQHLAARREVRLLLMLYSLSGDETSRPSRLWWSVGWCAGSVAAALGSLVLLVLAAMSDGMVVLSLLLAAALVLVGAASCSAGALVLCAPALGGAGWLVLNDSTASSAARADGVALVALAAVVAFGAVTMLHREPPPFWGYDADQQPAPQGVPVPER
jgi:hypothetical protein